MSLTRRRLLLKTLPVLLAAPAVFTARAQPGGFPQPGKPIRFIVPFPAGGTSDLRARQVAERMRLDAGWTVLVDNRAGASGMIGSEACARATPDGHTLLLGTIGSLAINPHLFAQQPYDVSRDFQPITQFSRSVTVLLAHRNTGYRSLADVEVAVRAGRPLAYASTGNGTIGHMVGEIYKRRAGLDITHVPYKGTAPAVQDFISGQVPLLYETPSAVWEHLRAGTAVALAVSSSVRMPQMPGVPTFRESGYVDMVFDTWQGAVTTRGVPAAVLASLHREMAKALRHPDVVKSHEEQVNVVVANSPEEFGRFIAAETTRWGQVVRETAVLPS
ncbi:Bug family tripartite tricarboxylate transporter substrate binding protein [Polaromonas sp. SM01]|uniref:Bug family tripartite tricarboxylate transporter substrate binding protein n=1 Tax=Polaromonas sp. SM01 TaxID=3085630 RepID=UPI002980E732|nr:tripartite tricarboxylate transporter substrate-binding protein [Polaromonas sp. SM01]MDW5444599.1 tripartite tricarboxylate transporter substrate-binding protein [Polaromonas sp. SM01]